MLLIEETFERFGYFIEDFTEFSSKKVIIQCDYCGEKVKKPIASFHIQHKNSMKDSCNKRECKNKKLSETKLKKSGIPNGYRKCSKCGEVKELNSNNFTKSGKQGFRYECKECLKTKYHDNKELVTESKIPLDEAKVIYEDCLKNDSVVPYNFIDRIDDLNGFIDYIFKEKTNEYNNKFKNVNMKFITKYKLHPLLSKYKSIYSLIINFYPNYINPWQLTKSPQGLWKKDDIVFSALKWFIKHLKLDGIIKDIKDIPKVCNHELFDKYELGGLLSHRFNSSPFLAIDFIFPNRFLKREFNLPHSYYSSIENRTEITLEFVEQLIKDNIINSVDEIPQKIDINIFRQYELVNFLLHVYQGISWKAFNELYPDKWKVWEFNSCPNGFWDDNKNIHEGIDWLVEKLFKDDIVKRISELPSVFSYKLFSKYNVAKLYYKREIAYEYLTEKYPSELTIDLFNLCIANDGTRCLSKQEVIIHNLFLDNDVNAKYCTKTTIFRNSKEEERYSPDWIVNENIIIEYFGLYVDYYHNNSLLTNYRGKTERKIIYYENLDDYEFIALYPEDINNNFTGLISKFKQYSINIDPKEKKFS